MVPISTQPAIDDDGFVLWDSTAILCYLADKNGWDGYYPKELQARAQVDKLMAWHQRNTRELTVGLCETPPVQTPFSLRVTCTCRKRSRRTRALCDLHHPERNS